MLGGCLLLCEIRTRYELMGDIDKVISVLMKMGLHGLCLA